MRYAFYTLFFALIFNCFVSKAQDSTYYYQQAYEIIDSMLSGKTQLNFKKAVLTTENAFFDGQINYLGIEHELKVLKNLIIASKQSNPLQYNATDKNIVETHASIFHVLTDTISIFIDKSNVIIHIPYTYDFEDMWGQKDWSKMFVSKLLNTTKGNCHSMPYLYKILAEDLEIPAYLSFAPNHIYIKLYCKKTGWYNTELTSATFPVDAWIMASGYVHLDAIRNGLYMDTLSLQQSVAYCLMDLAQGYQQKIGKSNPDFVVKCCNTVLKYHAVNVNAMLTKAEAQKRFIDAKMKSKNFKNPKDLFADNSIKTMYSDMEQTYTRLYQLGYRRMPEEMYMQWMGMLKTEPEKYVDKKLIHKFDNR
jgi:hypothetical protein